MIKIFILLIICVLSVNINAQTADVSGYIQTEFQNEQDGSYHFGVRRGRIKAAFESDKSLSAVFQADMTEKGVALKDAYLSIKPDFYRNIELKGGVMKRIFGREIPLSSSVR
ncbi:MAG: hypothetical protein LBR66_01130, partial [Candidatus Symbiothrix sp.]|nr:hypothetical protein [Candidatus Symbiothrix sp.]